MVSHTSRSLDHVITFTTRRFTIRDHPTLKVVYKYRPGRPCPIVNPTNLVLKLVLKNDNHIPTSLSYSVQFRSSCSVMSTSTYFTRNLKTVRIISGGAFLVVLACPLSFPDTGVLRGNLNPQCVTCGMDRRECSSLFVSAFVRSFAQSLRTLAAPTSAKPSHTH